MKAEEKLNATLYPLLLPALSLLALLRARSRGRRRYSGSAAAYRRIRVRGRSLLG